jgi:hypothetical protein
MGTPQHILGAIYRAVDSMNVELPPDRLQLQNDHCGVMNQCDTHVGFSGSTSAVIVWLLCARQLVGSSMGLKDYFYFRTSCDLEQLPLPVEALPVFYERTY